MKKIRKRNIDFASFFQKGTKKINDNFGIIWINGKQGTGKTYFATYYCYQYLQKFSNKIKTNIGSLNIPNFEIEYFTELDSILDDIDSCIYIIDEVSKKYTKESKQDKRFYSWLQQSRKRKRFVIMITQEYLQTPNWLRGVCDSAYTTFKFPIFPIFKTIQGIPVLNEDDKQWSLEPIRSFVYKRTNFIASMYDTFEPVNTL